MGMKALLYCSTDFAYVLEQCKDTCLSRMEFSEMFYSAGEELVFFNQLNIISSLEQLHLSTLEKLNHSNQLPIIYRETSMQAVLD